MASHDPKLREIFNRAMEIETGAEQAAYLIDACGDNAELRARVDELLQAHREAGNFLVEKTGCRAAMTVDGSIAESPGTVIGSYKLLEKIGEGGFGIVFMAEQTEPIRRKVALKILKPGMDTRQVVARFEAERQALAIMDHPNIANVLDGGATATGRPYLVMELVKGVSITEFCDHHQLTPRQRLELFLPVCQAVQHAHQKGIIHRDLKPSNVLVVAYEPRPIVKVIDFGVAKAVGQVLTDKTLFTGFAQMVGTPLYMSPEQAGQSGLDIDTRTDIYSLGVLLYELLTGTTPFDKERFKMAAYDEIRRIIREEEPPKPSTRLSDSGDSLPSISAQRHMEPAKLTRLVRGDLDWIVMKALDKDRNRRYETASAFAADVQRYLNDEPVTACPPSAWYRFRKFARRNRAPLIGVSLVAVVLAVSTAISTWQAIVATEAESLAEDRLVKATEARQAAFASKTDADQRRDEAIREKDEKEKALAKVVQEKARADQNLARARKAVKDYLTEVAGSRRLKEADLHKLRLDLLASAIPFYEEFVKQKSDDPELEVERGYAYGDLATLREDLGDLDQALANHEQRRAVFERLKKDYPRNPAHREAVAQSYRNIGGAYHRKNLPAEAESALRQALKLMEELNDEYPTFPPYRKDLAGVCNNLAIVLRAHGRQDEALPLHERAVSLCQRLVKEFPKSAEHRRDLAQTHGNLAVIFHNLSRHDDALTSMKLGEDILEQLVADFPAVPDYREGWASSLNNKSVVLCEIGRRGPGLKAQEQALRLHEKLASDFPSVLSYRQDVAMSRLNLAVLLMEMDRLHEALECCDKGLEILDRLVQEGPPNLPEYRQFLALTHNNRAETLRRLNRNNDSLMAFKKALAIEEKLVADFKSVVRYHQDLAMIHNNMGELLAVMTRYGEAKAAYQKAIPIREKLARENPANKTYIVELAGCRAGMGNVVHFAGDPEAALEWYDKALTKLESVLADEPRLALARQFGAVGFGARALALQKLGRYTEALQDCDKAISLADEPARRGALQMVRAELVSQSAKTAPPVQPALGNMITSKLTRDDPIDGFPMTQQSHHKVHAVPLEAGQPYIIDLKGTFDTFLRIEDSKKKPLLFNDDLSPDDLNSRLVFIPSQKDTYRLVVTSYKAGDTGAYTLHIQKAVRVGKAVVIEDKLQETDKKNQGKHFKMHKLALAGGSPYTIVLESQAFDTYLVLLDAVSNEVLASNDDVAPGNTQISRIDFTPKANAAVYVVATSFGAGEIGPYRLTVQRYEAEKEKKKQE